MEKKKDHKVVIKPTDSAILFPEWLWDKLDWEMCLNDAWGRGEVGRIINSCKKKKTGEIISLCFFLARFISECSYRLVTFQKIYRMVAMHLCRSNLGSRTEHWFPKKEPAHRWTWSFDALGSSYQNTADRECETPTLFLKDKAKEKEEKCVINHTTADPFLRSTPERDRNGELFMCADLL